MLILNYYRKLNRIELYRFHFHYFVYVIKTNNLYTVISYFQLALNIKQKEVKQ